MKKFNYIPLRLTNRNSKIDDSTLFEKTSFFKFAFLINRLDMVGRADDSMNRGEALDVWTDVKPKDGAYEFELAVQLPFYLPSKNDADEYAVNVHNQEYIVSNRHCEVILDGKPGQYYLSHYSFYEQLFKTNNETLNQVIMTKSLAITKFTVEGRSASTAIEDHFDDWLKILNKDLPNLITALRYSVSDSFNDIQDCNDIGKFCPIYIVCNGETRRGPLRFASHTAAYQIQPFCKFTCGIEQIEALCNGTKSFDSSKILLDRARLLLGTGDFSLACIVGCMACETFLTNLAREVLFDKGLTRSKDGDAFNDLSFSQMLNLLSYFIFNMKEGNVKHVIGQVNCLRKLRNEIIHQGKWLSVDSRQVVEEGLLAINQLSEGAEFLKKD